MRNIEAEANAIRALVRAARDARLNPEWDDAATPRTDKPVRFGLSADYTANAWRGFTFYQSAR